MQYVSVGAYLATAHSPFAGVPDGTNLDIQIGVEFTPDGRMYTLHMRGDTAEGRALVNYLAALPSWGQSVVINVSN